MTKPLIKCEKRSAYLNSVPFWERIIGKRISLHYDKKYQWPLDLDGAIVTDVSRRIGTILVFVNSHRKLFSLSVDSIWKLKLLSDNEESIIWRIKNL